MGRLREKPSSFFWELVTLGTPRTRVIVFILALFLLVILPIDKLGKPGGVCVFKNIILPLIFRHHCPQTGFFHDCFCPACGITHGISRLMHGDIEGALIYNRLSIVVFLLICIIIVLDLKKLLVSKK